MSFEMFRLYKFCANGLSISNFLKLGYLNLQFCHMCTVCLDGSPPAYQLDWGENEGANHWLLHIEVLIYLRLLVVT